MPIHPKTTNISSFKGLNNVLLPENTPGDYLKKAINIDLDKAGKISKRKGYIKKISGSITSLWASENSQLCYAVLNGDLVKLFPDYSYTLIKVGVGSYKLSFEEVDGVIYFSSVTTNGVLIDDVFYSFGIEKNFLSPTISSTIGSLDAGTYQTNFTWVYSNLRESGCSRASIISVGNNSGIQVEIPNNSDPNILYARIYCSTQNGNTLYFSGTANKGSNYLVTDTSNLVDPLRFFNIDKAPLGSIVKYYRGRLYIASGNILFYSEPFQYDQFRLDSNYFEFPSEILEVMPVEDGIWIGSDKLYYLSGDNPDSFKRTTKEHIKIVEGTSTKFSGSYLHLDNTPIGYKWFVTSNLGIWVLFNQGLCINLTSENISLDSSDKGTAIFLQEGGRNRYLSILNTNQSANNSVFGDLVETTVIRNGIII